MNQRKENNITGLLAEARWILPVILWVVLILFSKDYLLKVEERSFFEYDPFWLKEFLAKPSGILSCFSLFLTQFLHIPWLGALIWVVMLAVSAELTRTLLKIPARYSALAYIPAAIIVAHNMSMGYIVYMINLPGFFFIPVSGYLCALLMASIVRKAQTPAAGLILTIAAGTAGYYVAGFYALAGLLVSVTDLALSDKSRLCRLSALAGAAVVFVLAPIIFVGTTTYNLSDGWIIGLPEVIYGLTSARMQLPLILAMAVLVLLPLARFLNSLSANKIVITVQGVALAIIIAVPLASWYRDDNFNAELRMIHQIDNLEWNDAIKTFEKLQSKHSDDKEWQPTRILVALNDLALIKTGHEDEKAFGFDDGSSLQKGKWIPPMSLQAGRILYLHYGLPGLCNRWCIEESVLFGWNYMTYKYLAMNAIVLGDTRLAQKYLDGLEHTLFYRKWAKQQKQLCINRESVAGASPYNLILPLLCYDDQVLGDIYGCELFLMDHFNGANPETTTPLYDRVALFFAMKSKQPALFWSKFFLYLDSNNPKEISRYYQEAAYLFGTLSHNDKLLSALKFDKSTTDLYNSFSQTAARIGQVSLKEARSAFPPNLRHTYYYYFFYANELQLMN